MEIFRSRRVGRPIRSSNISELFNVNRRAQFNVRDGARANFNRRQRIIYSIPRNGNLHRVSVLRLYGRFRRLNFTTSIRGLARVTSHGFTIFRLRFINVGVISTRLILRVVTRVNGPAQRSNGLVTMLFRRRRRSLRTLHSERFPNGVLRSQRVRSLRRNCPLNGALLRISFSARNALHSFARLHARSNAIDRLVCRLDLCRYEVRVRAGRPTRTTMRVVLLRKGIRLRTS